MSCPHCGYAPDPGEQECPLCGTPLDERTAGVDEPSAAGDRAGEADPSGRRTPWEATGGIGGLAASWWESLSDPERFYSRLDWDGGLDRPLLYFLVFAVIGAGFQSLWYALLTPALFSALGVQDLLAAAGAGSTLLQFFLSPFEALFWLAATSAAVHVPILLLADHSRTIGATGRSLCYAAGPQVLRAVPFLGGLVAFFWSAVLAALGLRAAHRTSTARAVGALVAGFLILTAGSGVVLVVLFGAGLEGILPGLPPS